MKTFVINCFLMIGFFNQLCAFYTNDTLSIDRNLALNIYFDCASCELNYFKENFNIVNYVHEPVASDVQIQITTLTTGSGGTEYNLLFIGKKRFQNMNDTIIFSLPPDQTFEETRKSILQKLQLGLVPFIMKTSYANHLYLTVDNIAGIPLKKKDPWNSWVFDVYGSASFFNEKYTKNLFFIPPCILVKLLLK